MKGPLIPAFSPSEGEKGKLRCRVVTRISAVFVCAAVVLSTAAGRAAENPKVPGAPAPLPKSSVANTPPGKTQSDVASKSAAFGTVSKSAVEAKGALDAHDLAAALKQIEKTNSVRGTVAKLFEPRAGAVAILNFDPDYKTAMTAVVHVEDFTKFPPLKSLVGKQVVVTGKIIEYRGAPELVLTSPDQVKIVE